MSRAHVPVDVRNPGHVLACIGLVDLSSRLAGPVRAGFDWSTADPRFVLEVDGDADPVALTLRFLAECEVRALVPEGSELSLEKWSVPEERVPVSAGFPIPEPNSPATLPVALIRGEDRVVVDHWGDGSRRDNFKLWAGMAGYPGAALMTDALARLRGFEAEALADPFNAGAPMTSTFRLDWRHDYIPLDAGFSLNQHTYIEPRGYPLVEVLGVIGLGHARPARVHPRDKLVYRYGVTGRGPGDPESFAYLPPPLLRMAVGHPAVSPFPTRTFSIQLGWPGQEGQARCITSVTEESSP